MQITRFEDLIAWQKARSLNREIYALTRKQPFAKDFRLCAQIQAASTSAMANIAEGFERGKRGEFHQFLSIAKGSVGEVRSHLYSALDARYIQQEEFERLNTLAEEVGRIINGLRTSISGWNNSNS